MSLNQIEKQYLKERLGSVQAVSQSIITFRLSRQPLNRVENVLYDLNYKIGVESFMKKPPNMIGEMLFYKFKLKPHDDC